MLMPVSHVYIYIYRERERYIDIDIHICVYVCVYIYIYTHIFFFFFFFSVRQVMPHRNDLTLRGAPKVNLEVTGPTGHSPASRRAEVPQYTIIMT